MASIVIPQYDTFGPHLDTYQANDWEHAKIRFPRSSSDFMSHVRPVCSQLVVWPNAGHLKH